MSDITRKVVLVEEKSKDVCDTRKVVLDESSTDTDTTKVMFKRHWLKLHDEGIDTVLSVFLV